MNNQKDDYNLDDSICDFLLIYNDGPHSAIMVAPYKTIVNASEKEPMENKESILKRERLKEKF